MEVLVKRECPECDGTGKNGLSYEEAFERAVKQRDDGIFNQKESLEGHINRLMSCGHCQGEGEIQGWVDLGGLVEMITTAMAKESSES